MDRKAVTHLIEVRLSPACETKDGRLGGRHRDPKGGGCFRAQAEEGLNTNVTPKIG